MTRYFLLSALSAALVGCFGGQDREHTDQTVQEAWCFGCSSITSVYEPARTPAWVTTEGILVRFPGTTCGSTPPGVLCWNEVNIPAMYCSSPPREVDPATFWGSTQSQRPFYSTAMVYFQPSVLPSDGVQTVRLNSDTGGGTFLLDNQIEFDIARRGVGLTFRYREVANPFIGNSIVRTYPRLDSAGACTARIFGATPETFGNLGNDRVDFSTPQIYQPSTGLRVARDAGPVCGSFLGGYGCTRYVHATEVVGGECWFVITRTDTVGAQVTSESSPNLREASRLRQNATCFTP